MKLTIELKSNIMNLFPAGTRKQNQNTEKGKKFETLTDPQLASLCRRRDRVQGGRKSDQCTMMMEV